VFDPPVAFRDLADYHLDFEELAGSPLEADLRERAEREAGCAAVVGTSGSGKSSLIAAVAASLSPTRFPVRVQGISDEGALTREGFALHIARETLRALDAIQVGRPRGRTVRQARERIASSTSRTSRTGSLSLGISVPVEFKAQVGASAREVIEERNAASVNQALDQLIEVTGRLDRRLLLVVEDTDVFMPPEPIGDADADHPRMFVDHVVNYLARDFPTSSMVAINTRYEGLLPRGTITSFVIPSLRPEAIGRLIEHYALRSGLHITAEDVAEPDALAYVAGRYAEMQDVRRTLELLHKAARKVAGENRGDKITVEVLHGL
jgi:energy-coupling factor transporter ATP-binding protein EcfA2